MCPLCVSTAALFAAGTTSLSGLAALVVKTFLATNAAPKPERSDSIQEFL